MKRTRAEKTARAAAVPRLLVDDSTREENRARVKHVLIVAADRDGRPRRILRHVLSNGDAC
jgi:hypothetical protein